MAATMCFVTAFLEPRTVMSPRSGPDGSTCHVCVTPHTICGLAPAGLDFVDAISLMPIRCGHESDGGRMTTLRFPADVAVGEVWWADALGGPRGSGHRLAIGTVEVPDGGAVRLSVYAVDEVRVSDEALGIVEAQAGTDPRAARLLRRRRSAKAVAWRTTWRRDMPDRALRNDGSVWGDGSYSVGSTREPVDLEFIRALPADSVRELSVGPAVPDSFAAVAHLAPGLRELGLYIDDLGEDAAAVIAQLPALESLALYGDDDGRGQLDDRALDLIADLPALSYLSLLDGAYTERGLRQLIRLPSLRHLHVEREGLTASMFEFAASMPVLATLSGLDEFGEDGPMAPAEVDRVRGMLPGISLG
jgi:hypothetical protein